MKRRTIQTGQMPVMLIYVLYAVMMAVVLGICLLLSDMLYARKQVYDPNIYLLSLGVWLFVLLALVTGCLFRVGKRIGRGKWILAGVSLMLLVAQIFAVYHYYFETDWDVATIVEWATAIANGEDLSGFADYFSRYPNNLLMLFVFSRIIWIAKWLGFEENAYFALLIVQCVLHAATGILLYSLIKRLQGGGHAAMFGYLLYELLVGLSPWVSIPYSDSLGLIFPVAILAVYVSLSQSEAKRGRKWALIGFLTYLGYQIKPQVAIVTMALVLVKLCGLLGGGTRWKERLHACVGCGLGLLLSATLVQAMITSLPVKIDKEQTFGMTHFLMMGMNTEKMGVYAGQDILFSESFDTYEARCAGNLQKTGERLKEMGLYGFLKLMVRKTLTNYNDGTFCWGGEGEFYYRILEDRDGIFSPLLRSVYYGGYAPGKYYAGWCNFEQMMWLTVLLFAGLAVLGRKDEQTAVVMLAIIGLTVFEAIFEARARYLYTYVPLYLVLAVRGMAAAAEKLGARKQGAWAFRR